MKGLVLAGGKGSRLYPLTYGISKQLLPVYNKPMIYYPLNTLKQLGITDILIIVSDVFQRVIFEEQLGNGEKYGLNLSYVVQESPKGLADAFIVGEEFIGNDDVTLILGDNVMITNMIGSPRINTIYSFKVKNPEAYGVAVIENNRLVSIVEKPKTFVSEDAIIGLYVFSNDAVSLAKELVPSERGELEIVDLIKKINGKTGIYVEDFDGFWFDCGTHDDLLDCSNLIRTIEHRTNKKIGLYEL
jgi:glucose-1-phosphate thymidylyltransferase